MSLGGIQLLRMASQLEFIAGALSAPLTKPKDLVLAILTVFVRGPVASKASLKLNRIEVEV